MLSASWQVKIAGDVWHSLWEMWLFSNSFCTRSLSWHVFIWQDFVFSFLCGVFSGLSSPLVSLSPDQAAGAWPLSSAPSNRALFRHSPSSSTRNIPFTSRDNFIHLVHHCIQLNEENYVDTLLNWISMCGLEKGRFFLWGVSQCLYLEWRKEMRKPKLNQLSAA